MSADQPATGPDGPPPSATGVRRRRRPLLIGLAAVGMLVGGLVADATLRPTGPRTPPPADAEPGRWVCLDGAVNTRDVGGYRTANGRQVKRGMVYRSGTLAGLSSAGVAAFRELGIKTVLDLRNRVTPWPPFNGDPWGVYWACAVRGCPMSFKKGEPRREFYIRGVRDNAESFRAAFDLLSQADNYPVLYHCSAGKDRTGVLSALLLLLLGVDRETVIAEFRLSEQVGMAGSLAAAEALLDEVAARGGIGPYLAELGVPADTQERIRAVLVETP